MNCCCCDYTIQMLVIKRFETNTFSLKQGCSNSIASFFPSYPSSKFRDDIQNSLQEHRRKRQKKKEEQMGSLILLPVSTSLHPQALVNDALSSRGGPFFGPPFYVSLALLLIDSYSYTHTLVLYNTRT